MRRVVKFAIPVIILAALIVWRLHVNSVNAAALKSGAGGAAGGRGGKGRGPVSVGVSPVSVRDIIHTFATTANIESPQTIKLSPQLTGQITAVNVQEGDRVTRGQVLIQLDPSSYQAAVAKEKALLAEGKAKLLQAQAAAPSTLVPLETQIVQNQAGVSSAKASYEQLRDTLQEQIAASHATVTDAQSKVNTAKAAVANAQAGLKSAQANETNSNTNLARETSLVTQGADSQQNLDTARTTAAVNSANVGVAEAQVNSAQAGLDSAIAELKSAQNTDVVTTQKDKSDIAAAHTAYVQAIQQLKNSHANTSQKAAYEANLAALAADVQSTAADLKTAEVQLSQTTLVSPIDGFVSSRLADPGTLASPSTIVLNLQELSTVWVNVPVPQEQIAQVTDGQTATVTVDNYPGRNFTGRIFEIDPSGDPTSRVFTIRLSIANPGALLKPGMFARVSLVTEHISQATVAPLEAIQKDENGAPFVWVYNPADSTVHQTPVTTGASDDNGTQITSGLQPGAQVVTVNATSLKDGAKVVLGGAGGAGGKNGKGGKGGHHRHSQ